MMGNLQERMRKRWVYVLGRGGEGRAAKSAARILKQTHAKTHDGVTPGNDTLRPCLTKQGAKFAQSGCLFAFGGQRRGEIGRRVMCESSPGALEIGGENAADQVLWSFWMSSHALN
jgi:hypothetical protein